MNLRNVILYPTYEYALRMRKRVADQADVDAFGKLFTTPGTYFMQAWDVWGDERKIVDEVERKIIMQSLLQQQEVLGTTPGTIESLARFVKDYAGLPALREESALLLQETEESLDHSFAIKYAVCKVIRNYFETLTEKNLIEFGDAIRYLGGVIPETQYTFIAQPVLTESMKDFFAERSVLPDYINVSPSSDEFWEQLQDNVPNTTLLKPAGVDAQSLQIQVYIKDVLQKRHYERIDTPLRIGIIAPDIQALYVRLASLLLTIATSYHERIKLEVQDYVAFTHTEFGKALKAIWLLYKQDPSWIEAATTFARSPYAEMRSGAEGVHKGTIARELNRYLRSHHGATPVDAWIKLQENFTTLEYFEEFLTDINSGTGLLYFIELANTVFAADEVARHREVHALCAMRDVYHKACGYLTDLHDVWYLLESLRVPVAYCHTNYPAIGTDINDVDIDNTDANNINETNRNDAALKKATGVEIVCMSKDAIRSLIPDSFDMLIVSDATSDDFSVVDKPGALEDLRVALGLPQEQKRIDEAYNTIASFVNAVREELVFSVPQKNGNAEEVYPAFFCSEIMAHTSHLHEMTLGEDNLEATLTVCDAQLCAQMCFEDDYESLPVATPGTLQTCSLIDMIPTVQQDCVRMPLLSPTELEAYRDCPYKWFTSQCIRPESLDYGFDALAAGNFVHAVFCSLYTTLHEQGIKRVTSDNLEVAHRVLASVIDEQMAKQIKEKQGYIPMDKNEESIYEQLVACLHANLIYQSECFSGFAPTELEYHIATSDGIDFAHARLHGRIDRVDTNDTGGYIVVDYKGSITNKYGGSKAETRDEVELPKNLQALIYAQAFKKLQDKKLQDARPCGAFYLNYKAKEPKGLLAGSYNPAVLDVGQFTTKGSEVAISFEVYLDQIEELYKPFVDALCSGDIVPNPQSKHACEWC